MMRLRYFGAAFAAYAALSALLIWHGANLRQDILGIDSDPMAFIWCLAWWPHALLAHLNLLHVRLVWQPQGIDLAWMTSVPLPAFLMAPVTLWLGPVFSYNILTLAAPVLAACGAYALCLFLTRRPAAAFCGGLVYGFSTYEMSESLEHLNLDFTLLPPLLLLAVLARLDGRLSRWGSALLFALGLAAQFYISTEIALTSVVFGGVAWALGLAFYPARRPALRALVLDGALAGLLALPLMSPFLWDIATNKRNLLVPEGWSYMASARLGNLLVTTPPLALYAASLRPAGQSWLLHVAQSDFTTGLPLLIILLLFFWRGQQSRLLGWVLLVILLCALGPQLWVGSHFTAFVLPWAFVLHLPLLGSALPGRFLLQASLVMAIIVAFWVREGGSGRVAATILALAVTLMPPHPVTPAPYSSFFRPGEVQKALGQDARVLILPCTGYDASGFWQAEQNFGFAQTGGYLGMPPVARLSFAAVRDLIVNQSAPQLGPEIAAYAQATGTQYVLAGPCTAPVVLAQVQTLLWPVRRVDDTLVFTVPSVKP